MNTWKVQLRGLWMSRVPPARAVCRASVVVVAVVLVALGRVAVAAEGAAGRSSQDLWMEDFLRTAEVVQMEPVGEGITCPRRVTLRRAGVERRAIFKTVDIMISGVVHTNRYETCFRDNYRFEVAAYRLDRLLGVALVPVTVVRELDGERGSLQEWIEDVDNLRRALEHPREAGCGDEELLRQRLAKMYVLDSLIYNIDRNFDNILVNPRQDRFVLIDHSRAFRTNRKVTPPAAGQAVEALAPEIVANLSALTMSALTRELDELLSAPQIKALAKRRDGLLEVLGVGVRAAAPELCRTRRAWRSPA